MINRPTDHVYKVFRKTVFEMVLTEESLPPPSQAFLHVHGPSNTTSGYQTWTLTFVTEFLPFVTNTTFVDHFENVLRGTGTSQFRFLANFKQGHQLSLNVVVDGATLIDPTPSNGTCATSGSQRRWPWAVPTGMTVTVLATASINFFAPTA